VHRRNDKVDAVDDGWINSIHSKRYDKFTVKAHGLQACFEIHGRDLVIVRITIFFRVGRSADWVLDLDD